MATPLEQQVRSLLAHLAVSRLATVSLLDFLVDLPQGRSIEQEHQALRDGTSDHTYDEVLRLAISSLPPTGGRVLIGHGRFKFLRPINLKKPVVLEGVGNGVNGGGATELVFPANCDGIIVNRGNTLGRQVISPGTTGADGSIIRQLCITGATAGSTLGHGVWMRARATLDHCVVRNFGENGINVVATSDSDDDLGTGNANCWRVLNCLSTGNLGHGLYVNGADSNAGGSEGLSCTGNSGYGFYDSSFLGNTHARGHTASNALGGYKADSDDARNVFLGCYTEPGQGDGNAISSPSMIVGGSAMVGPLCTCLCITDSDIANLQSILASGAIGSAFGTTGTGEEFFAHNTGSLSSSRAASYGLYAGYESDGTTKHPVGALRGRGTGALGTDGATALMYYSNALQALAVGLEVSGFGVKLYPAASATPSNNGELMFEWTNDTTVKVKLKGSDGTVRSATLTLT